MQWWHLKSTIHYSRPYFTMQNSVKNSYPKKSVENLQAENTLLQCEHRTSLKTCTLKTYCKSFLTRIWTITASWNVMPLRKNQYLLLETHTELICRYEYDAPRSSSAQCKITTQKIQLFYQTTCWWNIRNSYSLLKLNHFYYFHGC